MGLRRLRAHLEPYIKQSVLDSRSAKRKMVVCGPHPRTLLNHPSKGLRTEGNGSSLTGTGWAGLPLQNSCPVSTEKRAVSNMSIWCLLADNGPWRPFAVFPLSLEKQEPSQVDSTGRAGRAGSLLPTGRTQSCCPPFLVTMECLCSPYPPPSSYVKTECPT